MVNSRNRAADSVDSGIGAQFRNSHFEQVNARIMQIPTSCGTVVQEYSPQGRESYTSRLLVWTKNKNVQQNSSPAHETENHHSNTADSALQTGKN